MKRAKTRSQPKRPKTSKKRYSLKRLLAESKKMGLFRRTKEDEEWLNRPRVGRELI